MQPIADLPIASDASLAAPTPIRSGLMPGKAARQVGLRRSTLYREIALMPGAQRHPAERTPLQDSPRIPTMARCGFYARTGPSRVAQPSGRF
jgi:hypothetical protein